MPTGGESARPGISNRKTAGISTRAGARWQELQVAEAARWQYLPSARVEAVRLEASQCRFRKREQRKRSSDPTQSGRSAHLAASHSTDAHQGTTAPGTSTLAPAHVGTFGTLAPWHLGHRPRVQVPTLSAAASASTAATRWRSHSLCRGGWRSARRRWRRRSPAA